MTTSFRDVVERLKALHDLDLKILDLDRRIQDGPARVASQTSQVAALDEKIQAVEERVLVLKAQTKLRENELKATEQKIERVKSQASEVRTNKEFMAYRSELSNYQADADRLQGEILKILDVVEQAARKVQELDSERLRAKTKVTEATAAVDASLGDVRRERDTLLAERPALGKEVPAETLKAYERVRRTRGDALAHLDGEYCSACMERLTKNDVFAVQNASRLVQCKGCNRLLVA